MLIYHYSNNLIEDKIKIKFFGSNFYTLGSLKLSQVKRIYFYIDPAKIEYNLKNCKYLYLVKINKNFKLYNIDKLDHYIKNVYFYVKKLGYDGIISKKHNQVILFKDVKIYKRFLNNLNIFY